MANIWVISDIHMGGGATDGLEDFRADDELIDFVDGLGAGDTLVLNGDIVDFAQAPPLVDKATLDATPDDLLWTSDVSLAKLNTVVGAHGHVFESFGRHISDKNGRVVVTIGNHDLDIVFPGVQEGFAKAMGSPTDRLSFVVGAYKPEGFGDVVIQHGHQATPENCPIDPDNFTREVEIGGEKRTYLERVWGTDFVLSWYNSFELEHPYADNVKPTVWAAYHAMIARPRLVHLRDFLRLLAFVKRRGLPPDWKGAVLAGQAAVDAGTIANSLPGDEWQRVLDDVTSVEITEAVASLSPADRAALAAPGKVELPSDPETIDAGAPEGAANLNVFTPSREMKAARKFVDQGMKIVVFGHTHKIVDGVAIYGDANDGATDNRLYNPGSWIPRLNRDDPTVEARYQKIGFSKELLTDHTLYTSMLRAVAITKINDQSVAKLEVIKDIPA